jgi:hypothetical protein
MAQPLLPQCYGLGVSSEPFRPMKLHGLLLQCREIRSSLPPQRRRCFLKFPCLVLTIPAQMMGKTTLERLAKIFKQMPPVCDLESLWSSESGSSCIRITTISTHDFNRRILFEPGGNRSRIPIRQEIKSTMSFQITDQCPVPMPTTPCPVV